MDGTLTTDTTKLTRTARTLAGRRKATLSLRHARNLAAVLFEEDLHAKRVESLANGVAGVLNAAMLSVHAIGQAYAAMAHIQPRSGVKQLDRLLSNVQIKRIRPTMEALRALLAPCGVSERCVDGRASEPSGVGRDRPGVRAVG